MTADTPLRDHGMKTLIASVRRDRLADAIFDADDVWDSDRPATSSERLADRLIAAGVGWEGAITAERDALRTALIGEHRKVVAEWSGNFAGHVAIRDGWLEPDPDTGWSEVEPEACAVCDLIAILTNAGTWGDL